MLDNCLEFMYNCPKDRPHYKGGTTMQESRREAVTKLRSTLDEALDHLSDSDLREVRAYACALYDMQKRIDDAVKIRNQEQ